MTILDTIQQNYVTFFDGERKIADYILSSPNIVIDMPIAVLAEKSNVSEASISRFCKKLNLSGFHQLKIELAKISDNRLQQKAELKNRSLEQQLDSIVTAKSNELIDTTKDINLTELTKILAVFKKCRLVNFVASGNTVPVAIDASYRFNQVGILSVAFEEQQSQLAFALNLSKEDLLVVISNSGESRTLLKNIKIAKEKKIPILAITNHPKSPIAVLADWHLTSLSRDYFFHKDYYFSRLSAMYVIELLFLLLSKGEEEKKKIRQHENYIADEKI